MSKLSVRQHYLERHAEEEAQELLCNEVALPQLRPGIKQVFILPAYDESIEALSSYLRMPAHQSLLSIWVINAPHPVADNSVADNPDARSRTEKALQHFTNSLQAKKISSRCYLAEVTSEHQLLIVDRCSVGYTIEPKQGVGLARKIGADIAIAVTQENPGLVWMHFCDADVALPKNYFSPENEESRICSDARLPSAVVYPFTHKASEGLELESALYDFKLRYYVAQLASADSPYAYHALGSTMRINLDDYCRVRGVPKRSAGEDFYLLNKLAKQNGVVSLDEPVLSIAGRDSQRVPFGTGPALIKIGQHLSALQDYRYYHPESFKALGRLRFVLNNSAAEFGVERFLARVESLVGADRVLSEALALLRFERFLGHCAKQGLSGQRALVAFDDWFDAFMTLKFIHTCRDLFYPDLPINTLMDHGAAFPPDLHEQYDTILTNWSA